MRWSRNTQRPEAPATAAAAAALLLLASSQIVAADLLDCANLVADGHKWDFSALAGPHTITTSEFHPPTYTNTTYTLDLCANLKRKDDVKEGDGCPDNTRVCAIKHLIDPRKDPKDRDAIQAVIPIAGDLADHGGKAFEWRASRMLGSDPVEPEGVRIFLFGGVYEGREQRAIVEMECRKDKKGDEGEWESEDKYDPNGQKDKEGKRRREENGEGKTDGEGEKEEEDGDKDKGKVDDEVGWSERQLKKDGAALIWNGRKSENGYDELRLRWQTKYACVADKPDASSHWGFFTWLVILVFLATASYLIFGSWLNYNRYGARGWDLLPHGDTLRDLPYLLKDWMRRLLNTMQGSGSRGGYSAV